MPDDPRRLQEILGELHERLEETHSLDPELRAPLRSVLSEIDEVLSRPAPEGEASEHRSALVERMEELALQFESSHPTIAGTLNRLTHALSSMGI